MKPDYMIYLSYLQNKSSIEQQFKWSYKLTFVKSSFLDFLISK